jgi:hypothetical protein
MPANPTIGRIFRRGEIICEGETIAARILSDFAVIFGIIGLAVKVIICPLGRRTA